MIADNYGDFEFEGLPAGEVYRVTISAPGYETRVLTTRTSLDVYLGDIVLQRSGTAAVAAAEGPRGPGPEAAGDDGAAEGGR
jgi:hypothetical protein